MSPVEKIRNGEAAKSPLFILGIISGQIAVIATVVVGGIWIGGINKDLKNLREWDKHHIGAGPHQGVSQALAIYNSRMDAQDKRVDSLLSKTDDRFRSSDMTRWCLQAERINPKWRCPISPSRQKYDE